MTKLASDVPVPRGIPPTNEWKCCRPRETFPERAPLSRGWSSEHGKLLWAMYLSLPGDLASTDGLQGYQCNITPPLLWLLKKILPEIKKKKSPAYNSPLSWENAPPQEIRLFCARRSLCSYKKQQPAARHTRNRNSIFE